MKKDLILRMIDQLGEVIARIMKLNRSGNAVEAQAPLDRTFQLAVGFDRDFIEKSAPDAFVAILIGDKAPAVWLEPTCILIRLLHEQAYVHRAVGRIDAAENAELKALYLLLVLQKKADGRASLTITPSIAELVEQIPTNKLPLFLQTAIARYQAESTL